MSKADPLHRHQGAVQRYHMLWARIQELKHEGYSLEEIAYLTDTPKQTVSNFLNAPKPKRK